jgi:hypothetical protein
MHESNLDGKAFHSGLFELAMSGEYMKIAEEYLYESASSGNAAESPGCPEDQHHDQESCSRMDREGCPNGSNEDDGFCAAERATVTLGDRTSNLHSRVDVSAEEQPEEV